MLRHLRPVGLLALLVLLPAVASAQTTIAGTVKDTSGGVLPGVTVEASSSALIEKSRSAVTDASGQYRIVDLRPGTYLLTFTLTGFATIRREAVEVAGSGVIAIDADMRVGSLSETVTVTGETPVVDVQTSTLRRQVVLDGGIIDALPASRGYGNILAAVPAIQATGLNSGANPVMNFFTTRGGRGNEGTVQIDGMNVGSAFNGGGVASYGYDTSNAQEIQITIAGGLGETDRGGPAFNLIPKTGGNSLSGEGFFSNAGRWSQGSNLDQQLRDFGIREVPGIIKNWDTNFALGGPFVRDRLWFFGNVRTFGSHNDVAGAYGNLNAGDASKWTYAEDPNLKVRSANDKVIGGIRLTGQATPRNKLSVYYDYQKNCTGSAYAQGGAQCRDRGDNWIALGGTTTAPEAGNVWDNREKILQTTWTSPATSRLLFEAGFSTFISTWGGETPAGALTRLIGVTEQSAAGTGVPVANYTYRGLSNPFGNDQSHNVWRASASYVTGTHNIKLGYQAAYQRHFNFASREDSNPLAYRFNLGVPNQFTMRIFPLTQSQRTTFHAIYLQDSWTHRRLSVQGALRYERAWSWFPGEENGVSSASPFLAAPYTFPRTEGVKGYNDITPRMGASYDVFGDGKTALKVSLGKYLAPANNESNYTIGNPANSFQSTTTRTWTDGNRNYVPDCDLMNPAAQNNVAAGGDFCGAWGNLNFGNPFATTVVNPAVLSGWNIRPYDWQVSVSGQHEVVPRVSVEVSYNRRSWGNFFYTDNRAIGPEDYDRITINAPSHPDLPDAGGFPVTFLTRNSRSAFGATDNYYTFASDFGDTTFYYHSIDTNINARMRNGLVFQGGTSTGRGVRDTCQITAKLPELLAPANFATTTQPLDTCAVTEMWLTSFRGLASYTIPRIDVLVSAVLRSQANVQPATTFGAVATNGAALSATYNVSTAQVQQILGRPLAGSSANQGVNLLGPGQMYGERVNAVDIRVAKNLKIAGTRTVAGLDLYNLLNANTATGYNGTFDVGTNGATWLRPTSILNPRFVRVNVTVSF
jgi:hypothetical protein